MWYRNSVLPGTGADMTKDQLSNNLISLFNMQILNFPLCLVTVEPGISI